MVRLHRRDKGVSGIHHCVVPDQSGVNQTLYVGLYSLTSVPSGKQNNLHDGLLDRMHASSDQDLLYHAL